MWLFIRRIWGWFTNKPWVAIGLLVSGYIMYERMRRARAERILRQNQYEALKNERRKRARATQAVKAELDKKMVDAEMRFIEAKHRETVLAQKEEERIKQRAEILGRYR